MYVIQYFLIKILKIRESISQTNVERTEKQQKRQSGQIQVTKLK